MCSILLPDTVGVLMCHAYVRGLALVEVALPLPDIPPVVGMLVDQACAGELPCTVSHALYLTPYAL